MIEKESPQLIDRLRYLMNDFTTFTTERIVKLDESLNLLVETILKAKEVEMLQVKAGGPRVQDDEGHWGHWVTMRGRRVFIREGESAAEAAARQFDEQDEKRPQDEKPSKPKTKKINGKTYYYDKINGATYNYDKEVSDEEIKKFKQNYNDLPGIAKEHIKDITITSEKGPRAYVGPGEFAATFNTETGEIKFYRGRTKFSIIAHESGHAVYENIVLKDRDLKYEWGGIVRTAGPFTSYSKSYLRHNYNLYLNEDFAESFEAYSGDKYDRGDLKDHSPKKYNFIKKLVGD